MRALRRRCSIVVITPSGVALLMVGNTGLCIARRRGFGRTPRFLSDAPLYFHPCNAWAIHIDNGEGIDLHNNDLTTLRNMPQTCDQETRHRLVMYLRLNRHA